MAERFWQLTRFPEVEFDEAHVLEMIELSHEQDLLIVLEVYGTVAGFVAGAQLPLLASRSVTQVTELAYWIEPNYRGWGAQLLASFQYAARNAGAKYLNMIAMESCTPEKAQRIYRRAGFTLAETVYTKPLGD